MRRFRSLLVLVCLCLFLGASVASAAEAPSAHAGREVGGLERVFGQLRALLKAVWENDAGYIDPWGRATPSGDGPYRATLDEGCDIDPWGGCGR